VADDPLIDVPTLAAALAGASPPTLLDVRWRLGSAPSSGFAAPHRPLGGPAAVGEYAAGHLPDAVFLDLDGQLCGPPGPGGRHPLPDPARLEAVLRVAGVRQDRPVVVYDGGESTAAARAWWTLRWAGHGQVRVLDGGYAAWVEAGQPVTTVPSHPVPGDVAVRPGAMPVLDAAGAAALATDGVLIDVRAPERYRGETEPIDPVAGHIPGAVNLPFGSPVGVQPGVPVGAYCGSGIFAARTVLDLHRAGRTDAALYVGSWSHWITDPDRPIATGDKP
jgi:thiosulfate/3-mercaptopyruvate sulfurtransferase